MNEVGKKRKTDVSPAVPVPKRELPACGVEKNPSSPTLIPVQTSSSRASFAFCVPFFTFIGFLALSQLIARFGGRAFPLAQPQYWLYPVQTVVCAALLWRYRRYYRLEWPKRLPLTLGVGVVVLAIWISPQELFGAARRTDGFDPAVFPPGSALYWGTVVFRFLRLAAVVPFLEEIFWRGFLLRYLIRDDFESVPFGSFTGMSFGIVALCFALEHQWADFWPGLAAGALYNLLAIRSRSLGSCVLAHGVNNLLLGVYIMATGQWGFW